MANGPSQSFSIYDFILPPGTGKTSIASAIAGSTGTPFRLLNAVTHNKRYGSCRTRSEDASTPRFNFR